MSFFDEADEPRTASRTRRSSGSGRRPPAGRRPPDAQQSIQIRRAIAAVAILIVLILIVLGIHSCQVSARNSALKDYDNNVGSLITQSDQTGAHLFQILSGASGASDATGLATQINESRVQADAQLSRAKGLDVPDEVKGAQGNLLLALQLRRDGIANVARDIEQALGSSQSKTAISDIAANTARFYASDVLYKDYAAPMVASALHAAGIAVGGLNGQTIAAGQFLPSLSWLDPSFLSAKLGGSGHSPTTVAPGLHGHTLTSVSVSGTTLQTGSTNTIPVSPPPTFMANFTNGGTNTEHNVIVKASVSGTNISAQMVVPQTTAGENVTANVPLKSAPPPGTYTVSVEVVPVPGEKNSANNTLSFPVTFQ